MRLLLVEDDEMIGSALTKGLQHEAYTVDWVRDGRQAEAAIASEPYGMVVLDLGLPGKEGMAVLAGLRRKGNRVPVIIVTARDGLNDRIRGLDTGADDYLVKPFDLDELTARIRAVFRRHHGQADTLLTHGELQINSATREVSYAGRAVPVSAREFALLEALLERPAAVLSRSQLEDRLYGWGGEVASNAIEVHIHNLRKKLSEDVIQTVRGVGYTLRREH